MTDTLEHLVRRFKDRGLTPEEVRTVIADLPEHAVATLFTDANPEHIGRPNPGEDEDDDTIELGEDDAR